MISLALALVLLQTPPAANDTVDSATVRRAYRDADARSTVAAARAHRQRIDRSITHYQAISTELISASISALRRDRLMFRREIVSRIDWRRDGIARVDVLGARQVVPIAIPGIHVPDDLGDAADAVFDPSEDRFFLGGMDSTFVYHPFADGSEVHYSFRTLDTTAIVLQGGRRLRLIGLEVRPNIRDAHHLTGTVWVDADTHAMVRVVFRLARPWDLESEVDDDDLDDVPGILKPIQADLTYFTIEYGLFELHWWLPRLVAVEGSARVGRLVETPFRYERTFSDYVVEGDTTAAPVPRASIPEVDRDSVEAACHERGHCMCSDDGCRNIEVHVPADTASLLESPYLTASIYDQEGTLMTPTEVRELETILKNGMPSPPWQLAAPRFQWGLGGPGLVRYNRVEGLSLGARGSMDFGKLHGEAVGRIGFGDFEPNLELAITRATAFHSYRLAGYHRLALMNPDSRGLSIGNSLSALVLGRDDGEYYRASGVELTGEPATGSAYTWRLFGEHQSAVERETDASLAHLLNGDHVFRPNRAADTADELGGSLTLRLARGLDPAGFRYGGALELRGATGTFDFARAALTLRAGTPLPFDLVSSVEASAGTSFGDVPVQSLWYLGGPASVRGYEGAAVAGEAYWRGRAEMATSFPALRLALFSDVGWAGARDDRRLSPSLISIGAGASVMDGLIRIDLARAVRPPTGWLLHVYLDGIL